LLLVISRRFHAKPTAQRGRALANIHSHQKAGSISNPHQLGHRLFPLKVQTANHVLLRSGMILLQKLRGQADFCVLIGAKNFQKKPAFVFEYIGVRNYQNTRQRRRLSVDSHEERAL
jgi:hypothetical protein